METARALLLSLGDAWTPAFYGLAAAVLATAFALSHGQIGLALFPLVALGLGSAWLVMKTGRLWPSLALHGQFNFYFFSASLCRSLFG